MDNAELSQKIDIPEPTLYKWLCKGVLNEDGNIPSRRLVNFCG